MLTKGDTFLNNINFSPVGCELNTLCPVTMIDGQVCKYVQALIAYFYLPEKMVFSIDEKLWWAEHFLFSII
jgi:hypothetical protein